MGSEQLSKPKESIIHLHFLGLKCPALNHLVKSETHYLLPQAPHSQEASSSLLTLSAEHLNLVLEVTVSHIGWVGNNFTLVEARICIPNHQQLKYGINALIWPSPIFLNKITQQSHEQTKQLLPKLKNCAHAEIKAMLAKKLSSLEGYEWPSRTEHEQQGCKHKKTEYQLNQRKH
ncbi:hypothetical protein VitviT2T_010018 [Vitis vinifera]|uniref:Uncharacterized protein n=1 Tax=Vitis vinifera TaxID=29760 RepID=A0ABY9C6G1_VITVI|nr:hypothetical protein VitviT2T_010018 [Vitis vinifera]